MQVLSHRSAYLRGSLTVAIAMLIVLDHALAQPEINWFKVAVAMALAGFVAARAFMDQSLSMRDKTDDAPPIPVEVGAPKTLKTAPVATNYPFN